jgi:hypothetical protein
VEIIFYIMPTSINPRSYHLNEKSARPHFLRLPSRPIGYAVGPCSSLWIESMHPSLRFPARDSCPVFPAVVSSRWIKVCGFSPMVPRRRPIFQSCGWGRFAGNAPQRGRNTVAIAEELPLCVNSLGSFATQNSTIRSKRQVWSVGEVSHTRLLRDEQPVKRRKPFSF